MDASHSLWMFFLLTLGIIVLPGMDMAYVAGHALQSGWRGGLLALAGIVAGGLVHVLLNLSGLAALLMLLPGAFRLMLVAGSLYLGWIGWQMLRAAWQPAAAASGSVAGPVRRQAPAQVFLSGMANCLLNPKAYAFMLAVFPAFLRSPERAPLMQALWLALIIAANQIVVYGTVLLASSGARQWSRPGGGAQRWLAGGVGGLLLGMAAATLLQLG
ncbi:LysE family translocator [Paucibacter soli]|uniref:LysE family translocator n=1 Tax=Paucibacter soli TaxID=3133433 RepID=UPI0030A179EB